LKVDRGKNLSTKLNMNSNFQNPPPSPLGYRFCKCGCKIEFQPKRKDQIYLNKQHADYGYNNLVRKLKDAHKREQYKVLAKNDRILEKHFLAKQSLEDSVEVYLDILIADGFDLAAIVGSSIIDNKVYHFSISYYLHIDEATIAKAKIYKR
jgi:hypothetical protein